MAQIASVISGVVKGAGTLVAAGGQYESAKAVQQSKEYEATQMDINAGQVKAAAQRKAAEERRKVALIQSRVLALAAAGGGGSDPTVVDILGDLEGEKVYRGMVAIYEGEEKARMLRMGASARRYEGANTARAGKIAMKAGYLSAIAGGGQSFFDKYGGGGFNSSGPDTYDSGMDFGL